MLELQIGMENPFKKPSEEGAICEMTPDGLLLNIYLRNITPDELKSVSPKHTLKAGIFDYQGLLFLLFNFDDTLIFECPFNACYYPVYFSSGLCDSSNKVLGLGIALTDFDTNIIRAVRTVALTKEYEKVLFEKIRAQYDLKLSKKESMLLERMAYAIYPSGSMHNFADLYIKVVQ